MAHATRLLVLGGTGFVGRMVAEEAIARGWAVTVLNRGTHPAPTGARLVRGDRMRRDGLDGLGGDVWDLVVDTWSWSPEACLRSVVALAHRTEHYVYVSSRSVYVQPTPAGATETSPKVWAPAEAAPNIGPPAEADSPEADSPKPAHPEVTPPQPAHPEAAAIAPVDEAARAYAMCKATSERLLVDVLADRVLLARAGLILGPYENVGRLPWWLTRIARGGTVVAPGPPELPLPYLDVRDLASWLLDAGSAGVSGPVNVASRRGHTTMRGLLEACIEATDATAELVWAPPDVLLDAGVEPWIQLPIWTPPGPLHDTLHGADVSLAVAAGLRCRPVEETVEATWDWLRRAGEVPRRSDRPPVGIDASLEARLLAALSRPVGPQHGAARRPPPHPPAP